ncbi:MAG TPA: DUF11 domain-containing protein, partial [Anaerolineae bacterium]|nr:DUF11 domain-containing protein [Anaerolineae bacterium]
ADAPLGTSLTNLARVVFDANTTLDTNQVWNTIGVLTDLALTQSVDPNPGIVGHALTYTLHITNRGPDESTGVVVTDTLPVSVTLRSAASSQGSCSGTSSVICNLGLFPSKTSITVTLVVTPTVTGLITNTAHVESTAIDINAIDNSGVINTLISAAPKYIIFLPLVRRTR